MVMRETIAARHRVGAGLWTRLRCGRGHLAEHPNGVTVADLDADCWCRSPRIAATEYRISETVGDSSSSHGVTASLSYQAARPGPLGGSALSPSDAEHSG